jgi:hypothetical protein
MAVANKKYRMIVRRMDIAKAHSPFGDFTGIWCAIAWFLCVQKQKEKINGKKKRIFHFPLDKRGRKRYNSMR